MYWHVNYHVFNILQIMQPLLDNYHKPAEYSAIQSNKRTKN